MGYWASSIAVHPSSRELVSPYLCSPRQISLSDLLFPGRRGRDKDSWSRLKDTMICKTPPTSAEM